MKTSASTGFRAGIVACLAALAGCTSMSGLSGSSSLSCKAPDGVICDSVSGIYANAVQNNLPGQRRGAAAVLPAQDLGAASAPSAAASAAAPQRTGLPSRPAAPLAAGAADMPLRSSARILRLWFKPWEDADRDLNGESLVYVQIDNGRWLVDHVQRQARDAYAPIRPTRLPTSAGKGQSPDARDSDTRPHSQQLQQGQAAPEDGSAVAQALRALQARPATPPGN